MTERTEAQRGAMNRLYATLRKHSSDGFMADGLCYFRGVPKWVVVAYVAARFENRVELGRACIAAHVGAEVTERFGVDPGWAGWMIGRAWAGRLAEIETAANTTVRAVA